MYGTTVRTLIALVLALGAAYAAPLADAQAMNVADAGSGGAREAAREAAMGIERRMLGLVNADRTAAGLPPLELAADLASVARWRSEDMVARGYFSHEIAGVPGRNVFDVLEERGVTFSLAGENLAFNYYGAGETAGRAEGSLMDSPAHRANIVRPAFTHLGVGVAVAPDGRVVFTQLFIAAS